MLRDSISERGHMEKPGMISRWYDDKGFGFIQPKAGGEEIFLHISAFRGDRRPLQGDQVWFLASQDARGRLRAERARLDALTLDPPRVRRGAQAPVTRAQARPPAAPAHALQRPLAKSLVLLLLCVLPAAGAWRMHLDGQALWPLLAYPLASLLAFALYWQDKRRAARGAWRTPEARLHLFELLGGWPGALIAQQVFRHKTRKISFQLLFWGIVLLHQLFWLDTLLGGWLSATLLQRLS
ncbi:DUF1294 domain-containing protein [Pseudomonas aeruginosa]|nr:DUF1294 domain-containing protein [Pseudomonas aeruginosa]